METEREKERKTERVKERKDGRRGEREGGRTIFALLLHTVKSKKKKQGEFDVIASVCRADTSGSGDT